MLKKLFIYSLMAFFLNYTLGCSASVNGTMTPDHLTTSSGRITRMHTASEGIIYFNEKGGMLIDRDECIVGTVNSEMIIIDINNISKFPDGLNIEILRKDASIRLPRVLTRLNKTVIFDNGNGRYLEPGRYIGGITDSYELLIINSGDVFSVEMVKDDRTNSYLKTCCLIGGVLGVIGLIAVIAGGGIMPGNIFKQ